MGISYAQVGRYETRGSQPPAEVFNKLAEVFCVSIEFLVNGDAEEKAKATTKTPNCLAFFRAVENMDEKDKGIVSELIDAFIFQRETQQRLAH